MLNKKTPIQFILSEGASAKLDGLNLCRGLQNLGYNAHYWFHVPPNQDVFEKNFRDIYKEEWLKLKGKLLERPEYVFTVKPRNDELLIKFKNQGAKLVYIFEDETLLPERRKIYDFVVSSSFSWKRTAELGFAGLPCYLIRDEQDYYTTKAHVPSMYSINPHSLRIVTAGHMECLKHHFNILPILRQRYRDITIVSNWIDKEIFPDVQFEKWVPKFDYFNKDHDRIMTEQFLKYDVAVVTQFPAGLDRNSSRLRTFIYAGLPVVAIDSENHRDLWLNGDAPKIFLVKEESDWLDYLAVLEDYKTRQEVVNYNYEKVKKYAGIEKAALTFIEAIKQYENTH